MPLQFWRNIDKDKPIKNKTCVEGLLNGDTEVLSPCQAECSQRLGHTLQLEQEFYLSSHPEVLNVMKLFIKKAVQRTKNHNIYANMAHYVARPISILHDEIKDLLNLPVDEYYVDPNKERLYDDEWLNKDLWDIKKKYYDALQQEETTESEVETHFTTSSSFLSDQTSESTLPTPEPIRTPEPTTSEVLFKFVSDAFNKATYSQVSDDDLKYDTAYIELMKAVERAMEIPVIEIREDIENLFNTAYNNFDLIIRERERIAAEIAWDKRMRKKLKRSLRRQNNFKGYETPSTPKSEISSHESYKIPPPRPCSCNPQWTYNRYPKDRFGIYLPRDVQFSADNTTEMPGNFIENDDEINKKHHRPKNDIKAQDNND